MLVLSRKVNERILIDGDIRITVLNIRGNQVRLGIEAPGHVKVVREELIPLSELAERDGEPVEAKPRVPLDLALRRPRTPIS